MRLLLLFFLYSNQKKGMAPVKKERQKGVPFSVPTLKKHMPSVKKGLIQCTLNFLNVNKENAWSRREKEIVKEDLLHERAENYNSDNVEQLDRTNNCSLGVTSCGFIDVVYRKQFIDLYDELHRVECESRYWYDKAYEVYQRHEYQKECALEIKSEWDKKKICVQEQIDTLTWQFNTEWYEEDKQMDVEEESSSFSECSSEVFMDEI